MFSERTSVGLDVHARSVAAAAIDGVTGEVFRARLTPDHEQVVGWVGKLPGPAAAVYAAGPTGFGLARAFATAGIRCVVAAPSKILAGWVVSVNTVADSMRRQGSVELSGSLCPIKAAPIRTKARTAAIPPALVEADRDD